MQKLPLYVALCAGLAPAFIAPAQATSPASAFQAYAGCSLPGGPDVVETTPFGAGLTGRTVTTTKGEEFIPIVDGRRIMFAYAGQDFYANMKVETLPASSYAASKAALLRESAQLVANGSTVTNGHSRTL